MPLYTYVTTYRGGSYVAQGRRSNPSGFADWIRDKPASALPELKTSSLTAGILYGEFEAMPNRKNVWRKSVTVEGSELLVIAVQTAG